MSASLISYSPPPRAARATLGAFAPVAGPTKARWVKVKVPTQSTAETKSPLERMAAGNGAFEKKAF